MSIKYLENLKKKRKENEKSSLKKGNSQKQLLLEVGNAHQQQKGHPIIIFHIVLESKWSHLKIEYIIIFWLRCQSYSYYSHVLLFMSRKKIVVECYAWLIPDFSENSSVPA